MLAQSLSRGIGDDPTPMRDDVLRKRVYGRTVVASPAAVPPRYRPAAYVACLNAQHDGAYMRPYTGFGATDITIVQLRANGRVYTISGFFYPSASVASAALLDLDGASRAQFAGQSRNVLFMANPNRDRTAWFPRIKACLTASSHSS